MSETIVSSLIALLGVVISIIVSLVISLRETRLETQKLKDEYLRQYASKLFEKRVEVYPEIATVLVAKVNKINQSSVLPSDIKEFADALLNWEARNAIFLGPQSQHIVYRLHIMLFEFNNRLVQEQEQLVLDKDFIRTVRKQLIELFSLLKMISEYILSRPHPHFRTLRPQLL